jgi:hypothetical protein
MKMAKKKGKKSGKSKSSSKSKSKKSAPKKEKKDTELIEDAGVSEVCPNCGAYIDLGVEVCPICDEQIKAKADSVPEDEEGGEVTIADEEPMAEEMKEDDSLMIRVFEWQAEGYETGELEQLIKDGDPNVDKKFKKYEDNIEKLKTIIEDLEGMEADERVVQEIKAIKEKINDPMMVDEIKADVDMLMTKLEANKLRDELYSIDTRGFEADVQKFEELIHTHDGIAEAKKILKKLQRLAKEKFFEGEIAKVFTPPEKRRIKKVRIIIRPTEKKGGKFNVNDLMILHKDGTLVSHLTRRSREEIGQIKLSNLTHLIQSRLAMPHEGVQKVEYNNNRILIEKGAHLSMAVIIAGEERKEVCELMTKSVQLLEKRYLPILHKWNRDPTTLRGIERYINILMEAFVKMEG